MKRAPSFDISLGIEWYVTDTSPCGGRIKESPEDFVVEEVLEGGVVVSTSGVELQQRPGPWLWVHVVKRNVDTLKLINTLRRSLKLRKFDVGIGGIKDTRAVTSQIISLFGVNAEDLPKIPGVEFKRAWRMDSPISPSRIEGNKFTVIVRDTDVGCAARTLEVLSSMPLPNYYGYQRFGTVRPVSHLLGKALIRRDAEEFLRVMFCQVFEAESPAAREARELACRGDYLAALSKMPKSMLEERALLKALASGRDPWNAIMAIPRDILKIYVEAYQSYLFNKMLSLRLEEGPLGAAEDDLALTRGYPVPITYAEDKRPVLPMPGAGLVIPESRARTYLMKVLEEEGVELKDFALARVGTTGSYRHIFVTPIWEAKEPGAGIIKLSFRMPRGSYATILLREIIKPERPYLHGF